MPETVGRYEILEQIGHGGMGTVYKAFDPRLHRTVAVKVISAILDDRSEIRERFFREARSAGQLSHKNIIVIYDLGEEGGRPFIAMEYLNGAALSTRMAGGGRLPVRRAVDVMIQVCHALEYAHSRGIVHRDITPANIFITDADEVKILDFGLAHLVSSELTRSETIMGTVNYMSPEQVRGERVDRRADIFACGVVLYELLTGRKAFEGDSFANTLFKVLESSPSSLQSLDPTLPGPLVAVVERALAKRREDRYQTAAEMLQDLITCRDWTGSAPAVPAPLAATVLGARLPTTPPSAPVAAPPPTSAVWSPRRVRTAAFVGSTLAILGAVLLFDFQRPRPVERSTEPAPAVQAPAAPSRDSGTAADVPATAQKPPGDAPVKPPAEPVEATANRVVATEADRTRATQALAHARETRVRAGNVGAETLASYRRGVSLEGEAARLHSAGQYVRAIARALEAEAQYRAAEIEARAEQSARERLRAEANPAPTPAPERPVPEPPRPEPPRPESSPTAPPPVQPQPPAAPADPRPLIRAVLSRYVAALEGRSVEQLKALWPGLAPTQERAIRSEFANARSLQVRLGEPRIDVDGQTATVTTTRDYQLTTLDGHRLASTTVLTMRLRRSGETWVIEGVTFQ